MKKCGQRVLTGCLILGLASAGIPAGGGMPFRTLAAETNVSTETETESEKETEIETETETESEIETETETESETKAGTETENAKESGVAAETETPEQGPWETQGGAYLTQTRGTDVLQIGILNVASDTVSNIEYRGNGRIEYKIEYTNKGDKKITIDSVTAETSEASVQFSFEDGNPGEIAPGAAVQKSVGLSCPRLGEFAVTITARYTPEGGAQQSAECVIRGRIVKKKLGDTITGTKIEAVREYNGAREINVTDAGFIEGVLGADEVKLNASAEFDTKDAGAHKTITVTYSLSGADQEKYELDLKYAYINGWVADAHSARAVINTDDSDGNWGCINPGNRNYTLTFPNLYVGEDPKTHPGLIWGGRKEKDEPEYQYKAKGALDDSYKSELPQIPGTYTVKAVFPETQNWKEYSTTADFEIYSEMKAGKKSLRTGVAYQFGGGSWQVAGDSTVYEGGNNFYATREQEYEFRAK